MSRASLGTKYQQHFNTSVWQAYRKPDFVSVVNELTSYSTKQHYGNGNILNCVSNFMAFEAVNICVVDRCTYDN